MGEIASLGLLEEQGRQTTLGLLGLFITAGVWYPLQNRRMPNTLALAGSALAALLPEWVDSAHALSNALPGIAGALAGLIVAAAAFGPLYLTGATSGSDVKLMAMVGAFTGPAGAIVTVFAASVVGALVGVALIPLRGGTLRDALPFGCFLAPAALAALLWGDRLVQAYGRLVLPPS